MHSGPIVYPVNLFMLAQAILDLRLVPRCGFTSNLLAEISSHFLRLRYKSRGDHKVSLLARVCGLALLGFVHFSKHEGQNSALFYSEHG